MPLACQLNESHFQITTKTLPNTRKPSTRVRGPPPSFTLTAGTAAILDAADVVPLGPVWTAGPLAHKLPSAGTEDGTPDTPLPLRRWRTCGRVQHSDRTLMSLLRQTKGQRWVAPRRPWEQNRATHVPELVDHKRQPRSLTRSSGP